MQDIKTTEREFQSQVVSWMNEFIKDGSYPFETASSEHSIKVSDKKTKFPDVQIWLNRETGLVFCEIALKTPMTEIDDPALLDDAVKNAREMDANYFVTWNMREAAIWRVPQTLETISNVYRLKTYESIVQISKPDDLWIEHKKSLLRAQAKEILGDLSVLYREGHLHMIETDSVYFVHKLNEAVKNLRPSMHTELVKMVGRSRRFKDGLFDWAVKQGIQTYEAGESFFDTVSRQIVYRLLGKILFYLTLRKFREDIPRMDISDLNADQAMSKLEEYFEIARQIDYQSIFEKDFIDSIRISKDGISYLSSLIDDLRKYNFSQMPQDVIGNVFEKLIPPDERHSLGQYFTNENLVDLITAFCVREKSDTILDPTCGSGTFLIRAYDRLKNSGQREHRKLLSQIWGIDVAHFPTELATINLYRQKIEDYANFPRIITKDFFDVKPEDTFEFPPPKPSADDSFRIEEKLPLFDSIVGNFPYIRQELIEKRIKGYKAKIETTLADEWSEDYKDLFKNGGLKISGQADIYAFMFFHAGKHLKDGGRMGIVTSNSWLDVAYGYEIQKFFLKNFKIIAILESRCEPWFEEAAINTIVTIVEKCDKADERNDNNVRFVKIKKRLKELIPWDIKSPMTRWLEIDKLIYGIEHKGSDTYKLNKAKNKFENTLKGHTTFDDDNFRIRVIKQGELLEAVEKSERTVKWGRYLRAPEIFFELSDTLEDKFVSLNEISSLKFGLKTGINEFFYIEKDKVSLLNIEDEYLLPIITSPKELDSLMVDPEKAQFNVFYCNEDKSDLRKKGKKGALNYINQGEKQVSKKRTGHKKGEVAFPDVPSVRGRKYWYGIGERKPSHFVINRFINERFYFPINKEQVLIGDVAFEGKFKNETDTELYTAILNSTITFLAVELSGRVNLGEGLLTFYGPDIGELPIISADKIKSNDRARIIKAFQKLANRPVKTIFEEVKMKDRMALDKAVLRSIGADPDQYLKPLYSALTELVKERLDLGKSRKVLKNAKARNNIKGLIAQVIDEVLPDGLKRFPEEFVDSKHLKNAKEISIPNAPLKLGSYFMNMQEVITDEGFKYEAQSMDEAKFIIFSQIPDSYVIKIPVIHDIIVNSVHEYERYQKSVRDKLFEEFFRRTLDYNLAETLVKQAFNELSVTLINQ